ncbi:hypothetical protein M0R45_014256 [Rubus argutus]|uniref:peroxidase n=1 Tax=Rubus argutus TaxID=59490 RepID=A0AAW1XND9_RUBAR
MKARWVFAMVVVFFSVVISWSNTRVESEREKPSLSSSLSSSSSSSSSQEPTGTSRLSYSASFFHDCFIEGCDASILLNDSNGNQSYSIEKQATPNRGGILCDVLALATRDGVFLAGGPFYPVLTGRRDSTQSYFDEALAEIPKPDDNITQTLHLFSLRGFSDRETVALLGAHNIGKIGCEFIDSRPKQLHWDRATRPSFTLLIS